LVVGAGAATTGEDTDTGETGTNGTTETDDD
jgi:hypothetical protein